MTLDSAETFVRLGTKKTRIQSEKEYCRLGNSFALKSEDEGNDEIWTHKQTGIDLVQMFDQNVDPLFEFHSVRRQMRSTDKYREYIFKAIQNIDARMAMRVRRQFPTDWVTFMHNEENMLWAYPSNASQNDIDLTHGRLKAMGLKILDVDDEVKNTLIDELKTSADVATTYIHSDIESVSFPIELRERKFWFSKNLELKKPITIENGMELLKYKYNYEDRFGYSEFDKPGTETIHSSEIPNMLFDLFTFRGKRMIDVAINRNPLWFTMRFSEGKTDDSDSLAKKYMKEFEKVYAEVSEMLNNS